MTYAEWIEDYRSKTSSTLGLCASATQKMVEAFPELKRVPGCVYVPMWGRREHWWCETPDGQIVDPTADQFPGIGEYVPWQPGDEVRVGRCMNCGADIYGSPSALGAKPEGVWSTTFCDQRCCDEMAEAVGW